MKYNAKNNKNKMITKIEKMIKINGEIFEKKNQIQIKIIKKNDNKLKKNKLT